MSTHTRTAPAGLPVARRGRGGISAAFFAQGFAFAVILTHLSAFETRWSIDDLAITVMMFAVAILAAVGSVVAGLVSARKGSAAALRSGLAGIAVAVAVVASAPTFTVFCLGLAVYGVALGCVDAAGNMQAVACESLQGRSILTSFHATWSAGGILGALETSATTHWGLAASLSIAVIPPLVAVAAPLIPTGMTLPSGDPAPRSGAAPSMSGEAPSAGTAIPWKTLAVLGTAIVLFYIADSATQSWSTIYLEHGLLAAASIAPLGFAAYQATSLISRGAGDFLVRRFGPGAVVRGAAVVGACGLAMAVSTPGPALAIVGFGVLGLGIAVVAPLTFAAAGRLADASAGVDDPAVRRRVADAIVARINQFNYVGFVLGGVLTGLVGSASSMRLGFVVPLVGIMAIVPIARVFGRR